MGEDPRVTAARDLLADEHHALYSPDPDATAWTPEAIAERLTRMRAALRELLAYVDEGGSR